MAKIGCVALGAVCELLLEQGKDEADGEPVFVLRARDAVSVEALESYLTLSRNHGGTNLVRTQQAIHRFKAWQKTNWGKVRPAN